MAAKPECRHWTGKAALTYVGQDDVNYDFDAFITGVSFAGIDGSDELEETNNSTLLQTCVIDADSFVGQGEKFMKH